MDKSDEILIKYTDSKMSQCASQCILTHGNFLDPRQSALLDNEFKGSRHILYGGYEDAERRIMVFLPDYLDDIPADEDPLQILRVKSARGSKALSHKDYLGSLLALGIDRNVTGDIIVRENEADIIILKSIGDFLLMQYSKAGHVNLSAELLPVSQLDLGEIRIMEKRDSVASLRLDNIVGAAFNLARGKAQDAIRGGLVFVNNMQDTKPDRILNAGDKIVLRGMGKSILKEIGPETRKGRLSILIQKMM